MRQALKQVAPLAPGWQEAGRHGKVLVVLTLRRCSNGNGSL